jgi:hypothetical protein
MNKRNIVLFSIIIILLTFDSIVLPGARLSIADISLVSLMYFTGINNFFLKRLLVLLLIIIFILFVNTLFIARSIEYSHHSISIINSNLGFLRPFFFLVFSINVFSFLKKHEFTISQVYNSFAIGGIILSMIVFFQFLGISPPMYHNNPSFGEIGRFTHFSQGFRPTGLTNEASFIGIFLILILSLVLYIKNKYIFELKGVLKYSDLIILLGVFFTTSRLALILGGLIFILKASFKFRIFGLLLILIFYILDPSNFSRLDVLIDGSGDNSTIERFGSNQAYYETIVNSPSLLGTGYLNANSLVYQYIDPKVDLVLVDRQLPSFSLPLQIIVEFGLIGLSFVIMVIHLFRKTTYTLPFLAVLLCSFLTGIQNFIFIYFFIAALAYVQRHSYT